MIDYEIGLTPTTMQHLDALGIPIPKATVPDYAEYAQLGTGAQKGLGWKQVEWRWAAISTSDVHTLSLLLSGAKSGTVAIRTHEEDGSWGTYTCLMIWPTRLPPKVNIFMDFTLTFRQLVVVP